jgi:hypothetical protein
MARLAVGAGAPAESHLAHSTRTTSAGSRIAASTRRTPQHFGHTDSEDAQALWRAVAAGAAAGFAERFGLDLDRVRSHPLDCGPSKEWP